jgi:hypothetical protein
MKAAEFLLGFAVTAAYWPGIAGAAVAPKWAAVACASVLVLTGVKIAWTSRHIIALAFLGWFALTAFWSPYPLDAIDVLTRFTMLAAVYILGAQLIDLRSVMTGAMLGIGVSSLIAIAQWFGFDALPSYNGMPSGLFYNNNSLAEVAALLLVYAAAQRIWWLMVPLLPALVIPHARGAALAVGITTLIACWRRSPWLAYLVFLLMIPVAFWLIESRGLSSSYERIAIWRDTAAHLTLFGHGAGSFVEMFPGIAKHFVMTTDRPIHPHNELLWVTFEAGFIGASLMLAMFAALLCGPLNAERLVLIAILVESCFAFPFQNAATGFIGVLVAGRLGADRLLLHDAMARRRKGIHAGLEPGTRSARGLSPS